MSAQRHFRIGVAVTCVLVAALALALRGRGAARPAVPRDPLAFVPPSSAAVVDVDVARLRASPPLAPWFAGAAGEGCEAALARRVRRVVVVVPRFPVEDFALVATGDLPPDALLRCARERAGGRNEVLRERYRGFDVVRVVPRRASPEALRPPASSEVVYLPGGLVLAGGGALVRRMIDQGLALERGPGRGEGAGDVNALLARAGRGHAVRGARWLAWTPGELGPAGRALEHVAGVALALDADRGLALTATLACGTASHADDVAATLGAFQRATAPELRDDALRELLSGARVAVRGAEVDVRAGLSPPRLAALLARIGALGRALAQALDPSPPAP